MALIRVSDLDDEQRCQGVGADGAQCTNRAEDGSTKCLVHGGRVNKGDKAYAKSFLVNQFEERIRHECPQGEEYKLMRENLMQLQMMAAVHVNHIKKADDLWDRGAAAVSVIEKATQLIERMHKLRKERKELLDRETLMVWSKNLVKLLSEVLENKFEGWEDTLIEIKDGLANIIIDLSKDEG